MRSPLILDVDTGVDDAVALALAVACDSNLIGVSTVAGNVPIDVSTRNTLDVLAALGRSDVPVHRGASRPLTAAYLDATHVHGDNGLGGITLPASPAAEAELPGPAFLLQSADRHAGELTIVMLGPLTNLAIALNVRPQIVRQVRKLVVMGGAFHVPGNVTPYSEFNIHVDPDAANQVLDAGWQDLTVVGLDVTHQTVLAREAWEKIPAGASGAAGLVRGILERTFAERGMSGFYLHDPLAVAVALDPELVSGAPHQVSVESRGERQGQTTVGEQGMGPLVATGVNAARFVTSMSEALGLPVVDSALGFARPE